MNWNWPDMVLGSGQCRGSTSGRRAVLLRQSLLQGPRRGSAATALMPAGALNTGMWSLASCAGMQVPASCRAASALIVLSAGLTPCCLLGGLAADSGLGHHSPRSYAHAVGSGTQPTEDGAVRVLGRGSMIILETE